MGAGYWISPPVKAKASPVNVYDTIVAGLARAWYEPLFNRHVSQNSSPNIK